MQITEHETTNPLNRDKALVFTSQLWARGCPRPARLELRPSALSRRRVDARCPALSSPSSTQSPHLHWKEKRREQPPLSLPSEKLPQKSQADSNPGHQPGYLCGSQYGLLQLIEQNAPTWGPQTTELYFGVLEARDPKSNPQQTLQEGDFLASSSFWWPQASLTRDSVTPVSANICTRGRTSNFTSSS